MGEIIIQEFSKEYQDEVIELILSIQREEFNIPISKADQPDLGDIPNFYQSGYGNFWVAIYAKQVIGTIALIDIGNHQGALRKMFVKAEFRGKIYNTAQLLLAKLMSWASEHYIQKIYLGTTERFHAAHRFYEKNKFTQLSKELLPDTFPIMKVDTRFYEISVK